MAEDGDTRECGGSFIKKQISPHLLHWECSRCGTSALNGSLDTEPPEGKCEERLEYHSFGGEYGYRAPDGPGWYKYKGSGPGWVRIY